MERDPNYLYCCNDCTAAIESHDGFSSQCGTVWPDENDSNDSYCDWCEQSGFDYLNVLRKEN